jgi:hypothetical protein
MSRGILKVAREGYDALTASDVNLSYDSDYASPKIFMNKLATPSSSPYYTDFTHNLGYRASFFGMRKLNSTSWCHAMADDDTLLTNEFMSPFVESYENKFRVRRLIDSGGSPVDTGTAVIGYLDPVEDADVTYTDDSNRPFLAIAKEGEDAQGHPKDMNIDSRFDTFKVYRTGTLTLNATAVTIPTAGTYNTQSTYYTHGLGYVPFFTPLVPYQSELNYVFFNRGGYTIPSTINVSELSDFRLSYITGAGTSTQEQVRVYITSSRLYLVFRRSSAWDDEGFPARTINLNYTIFYNRVDEEFDLL